MLRADVIRLYKSLHTWTGILAGMALFIAFYAGALTIFKAPLARWSTPPAASAIVPLEQTPRLIERVVRTTPDAAKHFMLHLEPDEYLPARLSWQESDAGADDHDTSTTRYFSATLNNGALRVEPLQPSRLAEFIDVLHRVVGLPFDTDASRWVMGIVAVLYALALISGVIVLSPTLIKDFFALRLGKNRKRMWLDTHNIVGIISLPFHIVMALTAVAFAFHDGIYLLQDKMFHGNRLSTAFAAMQPAPASAATRDPSALLPPQELLARAKALSPTFEPTLLEYQNAAEPRAVVRVWGHDASALSPRVRGGFIAVDPYSGKVMTADYLPGKQSAAFTTLSSFFALHFATFGGTPLRWMYFFLALAGAWLFYSGNLLWIESRRKAQRRESGPPHPSHASRVMGAATVGICLGCMAGISSAIAASKGLHGVVTDGAFLSHCVYYSVFFACIAWAFRFGAARASVHLLWFAALCTAAIPLMSLLAWLSPTIGWWVHTNDLLSVDLTAFIGSLFLAWLARATQRRVAHGPTDSIWSAQQSEVVE